MKRLFLFIGTILLFASVDAQQVINLLTGEVREGSDAAEPVKTVETLDDGYLVTWEFSEAVVKKDYSFSNCVLWCVPGFMDMMEAGVPALQYKLNWLKVGDLIPSPVKIVESNYVDYNYQLAPTIPAQPVGQHPYDEVQRIPIVPYGGFMPDSVVKELGYDNTDSYTGYYVSPFQYNYEQQTVRAYTKIVYKVTLSGGTTGVKMPLANTSTIEPFTLDGRVATDGARGIVVRGGKKIISNHK